MFEFRVKAHLSKSIKPDTIPAHIELGAFPTVELFVQNNGEQVFRCAGFESQASAEEAGQSFMDALLITGVSRALGVRLDDQRSLQFSQQIIEDAQATIGREIRIDRLGLEVFKTGAVEFLGVNFGIQVSDTPCALATDIERCLSGVKTLSDRQRKSAMLINDADRLANPDSQLVLYISAIEVLCERQAVGADRAQAQKDLQDYVSKAEYSEPVKEALIAMLGNAKLESSRSACVRKIALLLGKPESDRFKKINTARGKFVHNGTGRGALVGEAAEARQIAVALLLADTNLTIP